MHAVLTKSKPDVVDIITAVNDYIKKLRPSKSIFFPCHVGDKIHVKHREGMFYVTEISDTYFVISCKRWYERFFRQDRKSDSEVCTWDNYKCHAGGAQKQKLAA